MKNQLYLSVRLALALFIVFFSMSSINSMAAAETTTVPEKVKVGIYLFHINSLNISSNTYDLDFWIWFRWTGSINPCKSFEFSNSVSDINKTPSCIDEAGVDSPNRMPDGSLYQCYRIQGSFINSFNVRNYPLDSQNIVISLEDGTYSNDKIMYEPDTIASGYQKGISLQGWNIKGQYIIERAEAYDTNFGDLRFDPRSSLFSRIEYRIHIERPLIGLFTKTIIPIIIVVLITFCTFLVRPDYIDARFCLAITALLTAVALQFTNASTLPEVGYIILLDKIFVLSYFIILFAILISIWTFHKYCVDAQKLALKIDKIGFCVLFIAFFVGLFLLISF